MRNFIEYEEKYNIQFFPVKLKKIRKDRNLMIEQVALITGVSTTSIRNYEAGTHVPTVEKIIKLVNFYGISIDYFFSE